MKTQRNILTAFLLNLSFSLLEFAGGILTGSMAIASDAVHDLGDAMSIGLSFFLERKSRQQPDETYTYGYARYSVLGGVITTLILLIGSAAVIFSTVRRIIHPTVIHYDGMIVFAVIGLCVNLGAALITREGDSINQKAVNLHMLEDVLGWAVVLTGAVIMRFTDISLLDPLMSIGVALFILVNAIRQLKKALEIFLEKAPDHPDIQELERHLLHIDGILSVHHIHVWSMDGQANYATMHIVTNADPVPTKAAIREELEEFGITHATLELEAEGEPCPALTCRVDHGCGCGHHHHHH